MSMVNTLIDNVNYFLGELETATAKLDKAVEDSKPDDYCLSLAGEINRASDAYDQACLSLGKHIASMVRAGHKVTISL